MPERATVTIMHVESLHDHMGRALKTAAAWNMYCHAHRIARSIERMGMRCRLRWRRA